MGKEGRQALETLFSMGMERGVIAKLPDLDIVQAR
jgi:predicted solute-binding protein